MDIQVGSIITNGSRAVRITERIQGDRGIVWKGAHISLDQFEVGTGTTTFLAEVTLQEWRHVPFEWRAVVGGQLEERYVWGEGCRWLQREVRRVESEFEEAEDLLESLSEMHDSGMCMLPACGCSGPSHA